LKRISRYPVPDIADAPEDLRARMLEVQQKAGFVPNVFLALAHRPVEPATLCSRSVFSKDSFNESGYPATRVSSEKATRNP
jgi:hypothetical protein